MVIETFDVRPDDTLFLLDWDDTLLASSWLHKLGLKLDAVHIPDEVRRNFFPCICFLNVILGTT